jgi:putative PIN family toxin of toxin-antitoxin system
MEVIRKPRFAKKITPDLILNLERLFAAAEEVKIVQRVIACRDPEDDKFLELALNGNAGVIISGDAHLLVLGRFSNVPIFDHALFGRSQI